MISGDLGPIREYTDLLEGFVAGLKNPRNITQFVTAMVRTHEAEFNGYADAAAHASPKSLHHVYEWGQLGRPEGRLWALDTTGAGSDKALFYRFKASVKPVPITTLPGDTRSQVHIFYWKAAVMEAGHPVVVRVSPDKGVLVFPRGLHGTQVSGSVNEDMQYSKEDIIVQHPGGAETTGAFERLWAAYWSSYAERITVADFIGPTNVYFSTKFPELFSRLSKSRALPHAGISINTRPRQRMYPKGEQLVSDMMSGYLRGARQREILLNGESLTDL